MEWLKVHLFAGDEDVPVDVIEREDPSGEDVVRLHCRLLRHTFDKTHVKCPFVKPFNDHLINFLLHVVVVLLPYCIVEEMDPVLKIPDLFVCWFYLNNFL